MKTKYFLFVIALTITYAFPLFCRITGPEIGSLRDQFNREFLQPWKEQKVVSNASLSQAKSIIDKLKQGGATKVAAELEVQYLEIYHEVVSERSRTEKELEEKVKELSEKRVARLQNENETLKEEKVQAERAVNMILEKANIKPIQNAA